jgi:osmoprotectant transport system permease protein
MHCGPPPWRSTEASTAHRAEQGTSYGRRTADLRRHRRPSLGTGSWSTSSTPRSLVIAFVIAFPIGLLIGHTGRGSFLAINIGNAGRALPTLGVLMLVLALVGTGLVPVTVALVILAIPPILTTTFAGIRAVSGTIVDAARGVGMREWEIVTRVEVPIALPIIFGGLRNAVLQVISTATIAAYVGLGGLGRYLFDGLALQDYPRVVAGSVLVALVAVAADLLLALVQRLVVSPGVDGRAARGPRRTRAAGNAPTVISEEAVRPA